MSFVLNELRPLDPVCEVDASGNYYPVQVRHKRIIADVKMPVDEKELIRPK